MVIEQLIFIILAFVLFVYVFYQLIKKNDTKYVPILAIEALRDCNRLFTIIFCERRYRNYIKSDDIFIINNCPSVSNNNRKTK